MNTQVSTDLSLTRAKESWYRATADERAVQLEHKKLLVAHIHECISKGQKEALYTVPEMLTGPFPVFNVPEIALWLIRQCRRNGYQANMIASEPYVIRIRGWADEHWLDDDQPEDFEIERVKVQRPSVKFKSTIKKPIKKPKVSTEEASIMAQRGELSSRLKRRMAKYNKNH